MEKLIINGKRKLSGQLTLPAAKNAVLPLLALTVATRGDIRLRGCLPIADVVKMLDILTFLGAKAYFDGNDICVNCADVQPKPLSERFTGGIRSSIFMLGPILARFGQAEICYPGGCEIGLRPIDLHIEGLKRLGVKIIEKNGFLVCDGSEMHAADVYLDFKSVGATENLMMAALFLPGTTVIRNAAQEPEIRDLGAFINRLGGKVFGAGGDTVCVEGVKRLSGGDYTPVSDRIAAGTYMAALAACGGSITLKNYCECDMKAAEEKFGQCGVVIRHRKGEADFTLPGRVRSVRKIETQPFPGFPTDMQPQITAATCFARGTSIIVENLFENRFKYTRQLQKAGADITVKGSVAVVKGRGGLQAADMTAEDLRGGAALVIAALGAPGESSVSGVEHIDRGYYKIEEDFARLGADISRKTQFFQE